MPAKSQAQRAYLNARFGHDWVKRHHFDNKGKLPARVSAKHTNKQQRRRALLARMRREGHVGTS